ncbi:MAG TPA: hypothetical protein PK847_13445 [Candidatus Sumerlaeota bacterium]|nr:hypothetical protein [Candidatus Sumerlaeota bacterium]
MANTGGSQLHLPDNLSYECIRCGRSCGEFWEIPVSAEKAEEIRARPVAALAAARDPNNPVVESPWTPGRHVMRMTDGTCTLNTRAGLCALHAAFGETAKPNICRSFPFRFLETPRGDYVGLSFACTAVLNRLGPAVADQGDALRDLQRWTFSRHRIEEPPGLTNLIPLSWEQYEAIERDLADLLDPALGPIDVRLVAQAAYMQLLVRFLREAREQTGQMTAESEAQDKLLPAFRRRMRGEAGEPWAIPLRLARRRGASPLLRRMFLGFAHALRNTYGERRGRLRSYVMVMNTYFRHAAGRGAVQLPTLPAATDWRRLREIRFDPRRPELDELLTRYFRHRLFRKDLLQAETLHFGHCLQLMHWGLIHWYSACFANVAGAAEVDYEHLTEGLRNVEKYYVYHSTFDRLFATYPLLRNFLDWIFIHPLYAYSMGYTEERAVGATPSPPPLSGGG